ncbi:serine/threonine protein kinase [Sulfurifustis variabilis]|uniref:non-specific serine/threonine protein kinase n=1 Tax=Sulfurifustis variabilis TaxID=1675686 RepID=A0A1B4VDS6_9GAMM|nr:serine/threonine-protein kinase [Sulfurifustis variabilis]BAU48657.1 serine/threonine protein kinase [Sulfurifustis variabilis]
MRTKLGNTIDLSTKLLERRTTQATASDRPASVSLEPGTQVDRYLIVEQLGGGGMGMVYRALDTELSRDVALKLLPRRQCPPEQLTRFRAEAQAQARLRSPHIVTLYSLLELPLGSILVLEYVEGETLEARIRFNGPLPADDAVRLFDQILRGVEHMHQMGVVHRDLKPSNLVLTKSGHVKIMDFSVAKLLDQDVYAPGTMLGTLLYIPPEQISGRSSDARSDIYTLGISLYQAVTGRLPYERQTDYELMHAHVQERPPGPRSLAPSLSKEIERVILKAIEKEPSRRFQTAAEFRHALLRAGPGDEHGAAALPANAFGPALPATRVRPGGRRLIVGFALDLLLVASIAALLYGLGLYPDDSQTPVEASRAETAPGTPKTAMTTQRPARLVPAPKPAPKPKKTNQDAYDALREAWGQ